MRGNSGLRSRRATSGDSDSSNYSAVFQYDGAKFCFESGRIPPGGPGEEGNDDAYMEFLHKLSDYDSIRTPIQFTHPVGLAKTAVTALVIGLVMGISMSCLFYINLVRQGVTQNWTTAVSLFSFYMCMLCFYHLSEFMTTARYNPRIVTSESFLVFQSKAYVIAIVASWVEFWIEALLFPSLKGSGTMVFQIITLVGLVLVGVGQFFRTGAMVTAKHNFTHLISTTKEAQHQLVTGGLYEYSRHPSYFGWFWWTVGTQLVIRNPVCTIGFAIAAWKFFSTRIPYEEFTLVQFFPQEYPEYRKKTPVGIPFIA